MQSMTGRYVLVTGGTKGLGLQVVREFNKQGIPCLVIARNAISSEMFQTKKIQSSQLNRIFEGDICDLDFLNSVTREIVQMNTQVLGVVHCAAILGQIESIDNLSHSSWFETININLTGTFNILKMAIQRFKDQGFGHFVALSGGGSTDPRPKMLAYSASKTAVVRLIESVAIDYLESEFTFNCVAPGILPTDMNIEALKKGIGKISPDNLGKIANVFKKENNEYSSFNEPVELIVRLISGEYPKVTGKLISAVWDEWRSLNSIIESKVSSQDLFTLRRVLPVKKN